jgi:hypothetical protein
MGRRQENPQWICFWASEPAKQAKYIAKRYLSAQSARSRVAAGLNFPRQSLQSAVGMTPITIVEIYGTVAIIPCGGSYLDAIPDWTKILEYNGLFLREEATVVYSTMRTDVSRSVVKDQIDRWACMYHQLRIPKHGCRSATPFTVPTSYGHRFGFDDNTCVHVFEGEGTVLGHRQHYYKENYYYVLHGQFRYGYVDNDTGDISIETLEPGSMVGSTIGEYYFLECLDGSGGSILQRSTHHEDVDNEPRIS